jgi:hypothetical protein
MCLLRVLSILTMVTIASPLFALALLPLVGLYWCPASPPAPCPALPT